MSHEVDVYDHERNENNSQTFWIKVLYDTDEDGEKEEIVDTKITFSNHQVADGKLEDRLRQFAEKKIEGYEATDNAEDVVGSTFEIDEV